MKFYSTGNKADRVSLKTAVLSGMPADGGLFMPEYIPTLNVEEIRRMEVESLEEIALTVLKDYVSEDIPLRDLQEIVYEALNFEIPLKIIDENTSILELFHGPTLAFKDVGARFMSRLMSRLIQDDKQGQNIIVATSGDTGSAVANGFCGVEGIKVFILFPSGKVSRLQQKQMTTLGQNIIPLEVEGTFDDCQRIVKRALNDEALNQNNRLTTANSINVARLLPQTVYYFKGFFDALKNNAKKKEVVFCVPSGNFGNLCAGLLAHKMGLPIRQFVAATNINDVVPEYLNTGCFNAKSSVQTISNAMDVGNPSNFERILDLYDGNYERIRQAIDGYAFSDEATKKQISETFKQHDYILDPHGAVGLLALNQYLQDNDDLFGISLETAHPAKFPETVEEAIDKSIPIPKRLCDCLNRKEHLIKIKNDYEAIKQLLFEEML